MIVANNVYFLCRRRELKLKENVATSHIRCLALVASKTGTSRSPRMHLLELALRQDATIGASSPREEPVRVPAECKL